MARNSTPKNMEQKKINKIYGSLIGTSLLFVGQVALFGKTAIANTAVLGVAKSPENQSSWQGITTRLQATGVSYCIYDFSKVKTAADLNNTDVILLPNVTTITPIQVKALQEWMAKGGRVIASGAVGSLSLPQVNSNLRSLLGAYWQKSLTSPTNLQTQNPATWIPSTTLSNPISGGVLIPVGSNSQSVAVWNTTNNPVGVATTQQSIFLGWRWGVDAVSSVEFDTTWLKGAVSRYISADSLAQTPIQTTLQPTCSPASVANSNSLPVLPRQSDPASNMANSVPDLNTWSEVANGSQIQNLTAPANQQQIVNPNPLNNSNTQSAVDSRITRPAKAIASRPNLINIAVPKASTPRLPVARTTNPKRAIASRPNPLKVAVPRTSIPLKPVPKKTSNSFPQVKPRATAYTPRPKPFTPSPNKFAQVDDAPVAPAGLEVKPGSEPLMAKQVTAMRQELENLIGRFESTVLTAQATISRRFASDKSQTISSFGATPEFESANRVVAQAKVGLETFVQSIAEQDYNKAKSQWFQTRRLLWENYPINSKISQAEIRAIWLDRGSIVSAKSEQDLAQMFDQIAAAGINTVFFETINAGYTIYPSRIAPQQNPLVRGWDPLKAAVKLAHERGMELHAWVWVFAAGNTRHNSLVNLPANYPGPVVAAHPDWAMFDNQGRLFQPPSGKVFLDPANPEVRRYLMNLFEEIVSNYQVDGIQLDYIRYPFQDPNANLTYGYGKAARQQFQKSTGVDPLLMVSADLSDANPQQLRSIWQKWTEFRTRQVDSFVASVATRLRAKRPGLIISAAVFPFSKQERTEKLQQNWESWAQRGDIDLLVPMTYALDTNRLQQITSPLLNAASLGSTLILPGIRLLNLPDIVAVDQIQLLRDLPTDGYSLFAYENLSDRLHTIFSRTQGSITRTSPEPIPYREPFKAAAIRYAALLHEWNFLLTKKQIAIPEPGFTQLSQQSYQLQQALNQLATDPTSNNLSSAKTKLASFRAQFPEWMQLQVEQQPYQVQVWGNRLATLENLLLYGGKMRLKRL
jgi:uncharacterized lipoprotein YddW (UPF0748 family)